MTTRRFDAPASNTPYRRFARRVNDGAKRIARLIWRLAYLATIFYCGDKKRLAVYPQRFSVSPSTFSRDVRTLHRFGLELHACLFGRLGPLLYFETKERQDRE